MATHDDRLAGLERRVTSLEIRRLHDETLAEDHTPVERGQNLREVNENMTMLLGVFWRQGQDIREVKERLGEVELQLHTVDSHVETVANRLTSFEQNVNSRFKEVDSRFDQMDQKFDEMLQLLTAIMNKSRTE
ncbi:MAG: hypothetical protein H0U76_27910 [Ktedonobacteraceae bacterium]|nr:hypothetical protein [Ktedonobacteraceae bacterium]